MQLFLSHNAMNMLLTALLLANNVGAHGYGHSHVGGDAPHGHAHDATLAHDFGASAYSQHDDQPEKQPHPGENCLAAASVSHTHLIFFGFGFSIPDSDNSHGDYDESQSLIFVRLIDDCTVVFAARSLDVNLLRTLLQTGNVGNVVMNYVATLPLPQLPSAPLCGCARFERSGVLLI